VVADVRSIQTDQQPFTFQVYHPIVQEPWHSSWFAIHTAGASPESLIDPIRRTIASIDPDLAVIDLMTGRQQFNRTVSDLSLILKLLSGFALLALALAALGIYGVIARTVAQRTNEFGIRMALGAQVGNVVRMVLGAGLRLALVGAVIGLLGAFGVSRLLAAGLPGMQTSSIAVIATTTLALIFIALAACYLPARKASHINPTEALRNE
jgi:ABC-type antimicrobial peptide transport system permease subunit